MLCSTVGCLSVPQAPTCLGTASMPQCSLSLGTFCGLVVTRAGFNKRLIWMMCVCGVPICSVEYPAREHLQLSSRHRWVWPKATETLSYPQLSSGDTAQFVHEKLLVGAIGLSPEDGLSSLLAPEETLWKVLLYSLHSFLRSFLEEK